MTGATGPSSRSQAYGSRSSPVVPGHAHVTDVEAQPDRDSGARRRSVSRSRIIAIVDGSRAAARFSTRRYVEPGRACAGRRARRASRGGRTSSSLATLAGSVQSGDAERADMAAGRPAADGRGPVDRPARYQATRRGPAGRIRVEEQVVRVGREPGERRVELEAGVRGRSREGPAPTPSTARSGRGRANAGRGEARAGRGRSAPSPPDRGQRLTAKQVLIPSRSRIVSLPAGRRIGLGRRRSRPAARYAARACVVRGRACADRARSAGLEADAPLDRLGRVAVHPGAEAGEHRHPGDRGVAGHRPDRDARGRRP